MTLLPGQLVATEDVSGSDEGLDSVHAVVIPVTAQVVRSAVQVSVGADAAILGLPRDFVRVEDAAVRARVNPKTLYSAIAAGTVAGVLHVGPRLLRVAPALMMGGPRSTVKPGDPDDLTMTADELVEYLQVDDKTIYTAARRGELPVVRFGNALRFSRAALLRSTSTGQGRGSRKGSRR